MTTIYAVTRGSYSDYRIEALFDSKEKAKAFVEYFPDSDYNEIEEYGLNPWTREMQKGLHLFNVRMDKEGNGEAKMDTAPYWTRKLTVSLNWQTGEERLEGTVFAKNVQHALKIANEHRAQLIATNNWKPDNPKK